MSSFRRSLLVMPLVCMSALLFTTGPASADAGITATIGGPLQVTNKLLVNVPVDVVCDPLPGNTSGDQVSVTIRQASGKSVSTGTGTFGSSMLPGGTDLFTCDGQTHNSVVVPVVGSGPFHGGGIVLTATATRTSADCSFFCTNFQSEQENVGPIAGSLKG